MIIIKTMPQGALYQSYIKNFIKNFPNCTKRNKKIYLFNDFSSVFLAATEVFCKKRCSEKFRKIHGETPVPEPLFLIKLQTRGLQIH